MVAQNILCLPIHIPLAAAFSNVVKKRNLPTLAHHHDFFWERERFQTHCVSNYLEKFFPPDLPQIQHVTINSRAKRSLREKRQLDAMIIPNVWHFEQPLSPLDSYGSQFRNELDIPKQSLLILQPTRVVPRKGIEHAITLCARLRKYNPILIITHAV